jgi:hypothetical protein
MFLDIALGLAITVGFIWLARRWARPVLEAGR